MPPGGKRAGAGRKKNTPEIHGKPNQNEAGEILFSVGGHKIKRHEDGCGCWKCLWVRDCEQPGKAGFEARKYVWNRFSGNPVDTVNHLHDKPLEVNATLTLGEGMRVAMEKAEKRVSSRH